MGGNRSQIVCETDRASTAKDPLDGCVRNVSLNKRVSKIGSSGVRCFDHGERVASCKTIVTKRQEFIFGGKGSDLSHPGYRYNNGWTVQNE